MLTRRVRLHARTAAHACAHARPRVRGSFRAQPLPPAAGGGGGAGWSLTQLNGDSLPFGDVGGGVVNGEIVFVGA